MTDRPRTWWQCPNEPRCPHGSVFHDSEDYEDPSPTCCVDGCDCGHEPVLRGGTRALI